jgi:hypothetical protein
MGTRGEGNTGLLAGLMEPMSPAVVRSFATLMGVWAAGACAATEPSLEAVSVEGIWEQVSVGGAETTLALGADGSAVVVEADRATRSCGAASGTWETDPATLSLTLTPTGGLPNSDRRSYGYEAYVDSLVLTGPGGRQVFRPRSDGRSCAGYGWGAWEGTLSALVDGTPVTFGAVQVDMAISNGRLEITSSTVLGPTQLLLRIDASPNPLVPATFVVNNVPGARDTFYGFHHTHPTDATFLGFNTDRLSPPGTFTLLAVGVDRVRAGFSFRGNPIAEGQVAPDGRTTVLLTEGVVDLTYR